jgi:TRAP-type C4-dicarboxylate transport system permease small subunit
LPPDNKRKIWEERLDAALGVAASAILFALMLITFADVVSRYLLNWPLRGAFEATELMLLVLIFAGLPLVSHADEHVTMDFIDRMLSPRATVALVRVVNGLCAAVMFFLAWQVWIKAGRIAGYGDTTDVLRVPVGPFVYFMALMIGLTGLVHVLRVFVPGTLRASQATT